MSDEYKNPTPTVDVIIEVDGRIVLILRKNDPPGWAIPGGFVDEGESVEQAAIREAAEETGLDVELKELLYVYSDPRRDPRQHTMSTAFIATASGEPTGDDDAAEAKFFGEDEIPPNLAFDHGRILDDYFEFRRSGKRPSPMAELSRIRNRR
jgi:8-oxo-dGTP diphosphatase